MWINNNLLCSSKQEKPSFVWLYTLCKFVLCYSRFKNDLKTINCLNGVHYIYRVSKKLSTFMSDNGEAFKFFLSSLFKSSSILLCRCKVAYLLRDHTFYLFTGEWLVALQEFKWEDLIRFVAWNGITVRCCMKLVS